MELRLLGSVEIVVDGGAVFDVGVPQRRAVLAALAVDAGRLVTRETLIDRVWDRAPPSSVQAAVYVHIAHLRRLLDQVTTAAGGAAPHVQRQPGGYALRIDHDRIDLHRFRRLLVEAHDASDDEARVVLLRQAVALWRGEPLAGLSGEWAARMRRSWGSQRLDALVAWAHAERAVGSPGMTVGPLTELAGEHPLHEPLAGALMRALAAVGRVSDALDCYTTVRRRLADALGADPGRELQALHQAMLRGEPDAFQPPASTAATSRPSRAPSPPAAPPPAQLAAPPPAQLADPPPAPPADPLTAAPAAPLTAPPKAERTLPVDVARLVGRQAELRRLLAAAVDTPAGVVAIHAVDGMAGVGKTAFAIHAAHRLADRFPDGQRYVALRAHAPGQAPVDPAAALEILLQTDGVAAAQIPASLDARVGLWRDRMAGKRMLLVLDDAADVAHVTPLLPAAPGCLVLVTSRRKLTTLPNAVLLSLDTLPPEQAGELLVLRAGRGGDDPTAVEQITNLCGRLPLAIALTAARLHTHPAWSVADLAADLAAARDRLGELASGDLAVAAAFDLSYRDLPEPRQRLFRRLGLHPGPDMDAYAVAALDDTSLSAARRGLEDLLEQNLIGEPHPGRYRCHDLIAAHAHTLAERDPPAERDAARDRLLGFYLHTATTAAGHLARHAQPAGRPDQPGHQPVEAPTLADPGQAAAWFTREQPNLVAAVSWAATRRRAQVAVGISAALHEHLRARGPWILAIDLHHAALIAARHADNRPGQARTLINLADVQRLTGDYPSAAATAEQALDLYRRLGDRHGQAATLHIVSRVRRLTGDYAAATSSLQQALDLSRQLGDRLGQANTLNSLAYLQYLTCDVAAAVGTAGQALDLSRRLGDGPGQANALDTLSRAQLLTGDFVAAAGCARQALELARAMGNRFGQANALHTLSRAQYLTGDDAAAADSARQALELSRELGYRLGEANALHALAAAQHLAGDHAAADDSAGQALELARQLGDRLGQANALAVLGRVRHATGDHADAARSLALALELFRGVDDPDGQAETLNDLGALLLTSDTPAAAHRQFTVALDIARSIGTPSHEARALEGLGDCALRDGRRDDGMRHLRQALTIYRRIDSPHATRLAATLSPHHH